MPFFLRTHFRRRAVIFPFEQASSLRHAWRPHLLTSQALTNGGQAPFTPRIEVGFHFASAVKTRRVAFASHRRESLRVESGLHEFEEVIAAVDEAISLARPRRNHSAPATKSMHGISGAPHTFSA